jgi:acetylornithine deacetylase
MVPDEARLEVVVWTHPDDSIEAVHAEVEACLRDAAARDPWLAEHPPKVHWRAPWPPSVLDAGHPIVAATARAHEGATGRPAAITGFAAVDDATFLNAVGIPAITYGPGDLRAAHAVDESVAIDELLTAATTYALAAMEWCGLTP